MHFERSKVIKKPGVPVRIHFTNGGSLKGLVFISNDGRVLDAIERREYFPLRTLSGTRLVRSSSIVWIEILSYEDYLADREAYPPVDENYLRSNRW
ncbi:hypothetical protein GU927_006695 [Rhodobacteraceae bacterium HSP-20]|uniref:DUF2442 domain-containing protein n=1 Tax=Paragemmobacter amnigenus TaxID=2852097 RepID=A0ABS6J268_9RHOB|nr:hypothetical protein [Rhodobacter amnigenus]MBU9697532.1 hypothetical protein [Rhodobacter amnigenus]MBV4388759.1 hypothetical protein [Rhodobacter amnigenus]